ncbi:MAG: S8 family serine peptidase [Candidatus Helarchaeota archaeon]|nr:S8 family serine peptidase [Candidatus Helarchaeota archaeon]
MDRDERRRPRIPEGRLPPRIPEGRRPPEIPEKRKPSRIPDAKALRRCGPGIRRLLKISDEEIIQKKSKDDERVKKRFERIQKKKKEVRREAEEASWDEIRDLLRPGTARRKRLVQRHRIFGPIKITPEKEIKIRAIVDFAGNEDDLRNIFGIQVHSRIQNIFTVVATKDQLADLADQAATRKIRLPRIFFPYLADAVPIAEIDQIHATGTLGNGVITGIVDGDLHVAHHAFRDPNDPNHPTRVRFLWVQDPNLLPGGVQPPGQNPEQFFNDPANPNSPDFTGLDYGRIYDEDAINTALGLADPYGTGANQIAKVLDAGDPEHGTHVAGIAAGSGHLNNWAAATVNVGSAPLSQIVYVSKRFSVPNVLSGVYEDDIIDALNFVLLVADAEGRAVAINNSYGTNVGPHDGRTEFDQVRNAMLDSFLGRAIVYAAGNDNDNQGFRRGTIAAGADEVLTADPVRVAGNDVIIEVWYEGPDLDFEVTCDGASTGVIGAPNDFNGVLNLAGGINYNVTVDRVENPGSIKNLRVYVVDVAHNFTVRLENNGASEVRYWAWIGVQGWWASFTAGAIQQEMTLGDTACARSILSVGSCDKPAVAGNPEPIANYSGRGPTFDGRIKPEIAAVGSDVFSADSRTTAGYIDMSGTSMSSPLVTGAIALLLEDDPDLNQDAIKALLIQTADQTDLDLDPAAAGYDEVEHRAYGFGRLRMEAPFQHDPPLVDVDVWVRTADDDYGFEPYTGGCFCHAPEVTIIAPDGQATLHLHWNQEHTIQVRIHNLGETAATKTMVRVKYTRPWAAPDEWVPCKAPDNNVIEQEVDIPALAYVDLTFDQKWVPKEDELPAGGDGWGNHYCLLIELKHEDDPLQYDDATAAGQNPWIKNIKGTNNVALRNLSIL